MTLKLEQATLNRWLEVFGQIESVAEAGETIPDDLADELARCVDGMRAMKARSNAAVKAARTRKSREKSKDPYARIYDETIMKRGDPVAEKIWQELVEEVRKKKMIEESRSKADRETRIWLGQGEKTTDVLEANEG